MSAARYRRAARPSWTHAVPSGGWHHEATTGFGILGTSLGSCLSLLTAAHEPRVRAQALNHISPYFADVVWRGLSTTHVREGLEGAVELERLREMWLPISPHVYLDRIKNTKTLLVYAKYDLTFPVDLSRTLVDEFNRRKIPHELTVLPCGHYSTGLSPFKFLDGFVLARFLARNLKPLFITGSVRDAVQAGVGWRSLVREHSLQATGPYRGCEQRCGYR